MAQSKEIIRKTAFTKQATSFQYDKSIFQVKCLFLVGVKWNEEEMKVSSIDGKNIKYLGDHLLCATVVPRNEKVRWRAIIFSFRMHD